MEPPDISTFANHQLSLLDRELQAELAETSLLTTQHSPSVLARAGLAITNLHVASQRTGLGGKTVLDLQPDPATSGGSGKSDDEGLPEHGVRVGDIVGIKELGAAAVKRKGKDKVEDEEERGASGVVVKVRSGSVEVALDKEEVDVPAGRLWIVKLANDVTNKRMYQTMTTLAKALSSDINSFIRILFGLATPTPVPTDETALGRALGPDPMTWQTPNLNPSQKHAIKFALASPEIALIHGPPGTGKTHTLIELILQLLTRNPTSRLLVCGPSNISVDNIVERLAPHKIPMVRLGHPARLLPSVLNHSLDVLTKTSDAASLIADIRKELDAKQASIRKTRNGRERKAIYGEMRELRKEYRERERRCVDELVRGSRVVLATLHGAGGRRVTGPVEAAGGFDVVIVDEASQALEAACWVPLLTAKKAVLAGDHMQLPPTVKSLNIKNDASEPKKKKADEKSSDAKDAPSNGSKSSNPTKNLPSTLETTLFDRLLTLHGDSIKRMLTIQYRMNASIMSFPSSALYASALTADSSVSSHLLTSLPYSVAETDDTAVPLIFYDTQCGDFPEQAPSSTSSTLDSKNGGGSGRHLKKSTLLLSEPSKSNTHEAALVTQHITRLITAGVLATDIAVISPYNLQISLISKLLKEKGFEGVELGSVDGFQGREKEVVIVSLVRSNEEREVGFLKEKRRLNVAMTRARKQLVVVGDGGTVGGGSKFLKQWMQHLEEYADLRYPDPSELNEL